MWIPCSVKSGPFPNERRVYLKTHLTEWFGFVNVTELENKVTEGEDRVRAIILHVGDDQIVVGIRGQSPKGGPIQTRPSEVTAYGAI